MKAELICIRHADVPEKWVVVDGRDTVHIWIDENGIKTQRFSRKASGDGYIPHQPQNLDFARAIEVSEKQLTLFPQ